MADNLIVFLINSFMLGVGLSMDAFSVSIANGLADPGMKRERRLLICFSFAFFQALMPITGWLVVLLISEQFTILTKIVPYIAFSVLVFIGIKLVIAGIKKEQTKVTGEFTVGLLLLQAVATSIDALSAGLAFTGYSFPEALGAAGIIAAVTFLICLAGVNLGKKIGKKLEFKALIVGGVILILIGAEILLKSLFA